MGFFMFGNYAVGLAILLLAAGLVLLWIAKGFLYAVVGAIAYLYVLPMVTVPLLVMSSSCLAIHSTKNAKL